MYCRYCCTTAGWGYFTLIFRGCCSRDRMVVGFITTYTISVYSIQHYVIKFASDLQHVGGFLRVLQFFTTNETDHQDITDISILLKLALNTILTLTQHSFLGMSYEFSPCKTAINMMYLYFILFLSIMLDNLSCTLTSITFLTNIRG